MGEPQLLRVVHGVVERGAYEAQRYAYGGRPQQPPEEYQGVVQPYMQRKIECAFAVVSVIHQNKPFAVIDDGYIIPSVDRYIWSLLKLYYKLKEGLRMENRKTEYRKYALYTFLTLMIELSIASLMDLLISKFQSVYHPASYIPMYERLWDHGILKVICVTGALFLYFIIKWYCEGEKTHDGSGAQEKAE